MEWLERMKKVMDHIEECITEDINMAEIASVANSSEFHFQRVFSILTGYTLKDYIRRRRLTLAAKDLVTTQKGILEIALKYGYESQASFTKAFSRIHGMTPGVARHEKHSLKAFPPLSFHFSIIGGVKMNYEIKDLSAFNVIGKMIPVTSENGENKKRIPQFWQEVMGDGSFNSIIKLAQKENITKGSSMGICMEFSKDSMHFNYMIGVESSLDKPPEDMVKKNIPAQRWAIFKTKGPLPESIQALWKRIFSEWFPATNFKHAGGPELELYPPSEGESNPDECQSEVWIPIEK